MNKNTLLLLFLSIIFVNIQAQKSKLYIGGIAHIGNGEKISNSIISIKDGKFDVVGDANKIRIDPNAFDTIVKIYGKHIYPAFIAPNTKLGITEIDQIRASHDYNEVGEFNPNVRSLIAFNTDSKIIKTVRTNGVLITQTTPRGGIISGSSSIMYLDGLNWEDATLKADDGIHLNWPSSFHTHGWWGNPGETTKNKNYNINVLKIKSYFNKAKSYYHYNNKIDLQLESMKSLFNGESILYIHANYTKDINESILFFKSIGIKKIVLVGGKNLLNSLQIIKDNNISVILNRIHSLPSNEDAAIDQSFTLPSILKKEGILFCFAYNGDMEAMGTRNLPFTAGTSVTYGLDIEDAIAAMSLNTAKILGIDKITGSIEEGKYANFFISTGDALDMRTNNVENAFIRGEEIDLNNHQKELFYKYNTTD